MNHRELFRLAVHKYIVRPSFILMRRRPVNEEMFEESEVFTDLLFGVIPINCLAEAFDAACRKQNSSFAPNGFDIKNAWLAIEAKEKAEVKAAHKCTGEKYHVTTDAQVYIDLFYTGQNDLAPCPVCRTTEYADWRKTQIALYGEVPIKTFLPQIDEKPMGGIFTSQPEEILSIEDGDKLAMEHNIIICQLIDDDAAQNMEMVIFDEGGNVFKHKHRNDKLYSVKDLRKRIERYRQILEGAA